MKNWKAIIAAVLLTVTAFGTLAMVAGGMVYAVWTRPDFYDRMLTREQAYPILSDLLLDWMEPGLPNGRQAARYLRTSLTSDWVQVHVQDILGQVSDYIVGKTDDLPEINVEDLKELLYQTLPEEKTQQQRREEAWLLLSPLPDEAMWSDFLSPEPLYAARKGMETLRYALLILAGGIMIILGFLWALERRFTQALAWLGGALIAGAFVGMILCAVAWWLIPQLLLFWQAQQGMAAWGLPADFLKNFIKYTALGLGTVYAGVGLAGYLLMQIPGQSGEDNSHLELIVPAPRH